MAKRIEYRTCPLCEATCGLELHLDDDELTLVRGDKDDVFSHGYLCPKGTALKAARRGPEPHPHAAGPHAATPGTRPRWDEAFAEIERGLGPIMEARPRRGRHLPGQPERPQPRRDDRVQPVLIQALGTEEHLQREHRRPDAEAGQRRD